MEAGAERDRLVLSLLEPGDRAKVEGVVDEILDDALIADVAFMMAAAQAFDARAAELPAIDKIVAWQIAAALRERASPSPPPH